MHIRKKKKIDGIDREILRILYLRRPLVTLQIAKLVGLSDSSVISRLYNLKKLGIIKISKYSKLRHYKRIISNKIFDIESYRAIYWDLDLEPLIKKIEVKKNV